MVAGALQFGPGWFLFSFGIFALGLGILTRYLINRAEKNNKKVNRYWMYYKNKMFMLGIILIVVGLYRCFDCTLAKVI
jgi:uncharacterized membrane protein YidH (DUF202 family)